MRMTTHVQRFGLLPLCAVLAMLAGGLAHGNGGAQPQPGLTVKVVKANRSVSNLTQALAVLANADQQTSVTTAVATVINFSDTSGQKGLFGNESPFPGQGFTNVDDFVVEVTGSVFIPTAGNWRFGVNSDDGFRLIVGASPTEFMVVCDCLRGPNTTEATLNFPASGWYPLNLLFFERGGGAALELFAAAGSTDPFRLLGDVAAGGLLTNPSTNPAGLAFTIAPQVGPVGSPLAIQPVLQVVDPTGAPLAGATGGVSVAIVSGTEGTLIGDTTATLVDGVATFTNLRLVGLINEAYVLRFTSPLRSPLEVVLTPKVAGPVVGLRVTDPGGGAISSPKLRNIPFTILVAFEDVAGNPAVPGAASLNLTASGGEPGGEMRFAGGEPGEPVIVNVPAGLSSLTVPNVLYTGLSQGADPDVVLTATGAPGGPLAGVSGSSAPFGVRDIVLSIGATPASLVANGQSLTAIQVILTDAAEPPQPLAGQQIRVATTAGTLLLPNLSAPIGDTFTTDASGAVNLMLQASVVPGVAVVTALCPGACPATVSVPFIEASATLALTISARAESASDALFGPMPEVWPGDRVRIRVAFSNAGNDPASNVVIASEIPTGFLLESPNATLTCPDSSAPQLQATVVSTAAGERLEFDLAACGIVPPGGEGWVEFVVGVE